MSCIVDTGVPEFPFEEERKNIELQLKWYHRLAMRLMGSGNLPQHVAFIMDGNRRYARGQNLGHVSEGHKKGASKLYEVNILFLFEPNNHVLILFTKQIIDSLMEMGIKEITVYAFSIENFKRPVGEVSDLLTLIKMKLLEFQKENKHGIRVIGDIEVLPKEFQTVVAEMALYPHRNDYTSFLNIAVGYTSRAEMTAAINDMNWGAINGYLRNDDINDTLLESCLWTAASPPVDLVFRSSGEVRLSDFLLWQTGYSPLIFEEALWPEMQLRHMIKAFLKYQRYNDIIQEAKRRHYQNRELKEQLNFTQSSFQETQSYIEYQTEKKTRINNFLNKLYDRRRNRLKEILATVQ